MWGCRDLSKDRTLIRQCCMLAVDCALQRQGGVMGQAGIHMDGTWRNPETLTVSRVYMSHEKRYTTI